MNEELQKSECRLSSSLPSEEVCTVQHRLAWGNQTNP